MYITEIPYQDPLHAFSQISHETGAVFFDSPPSSLPFPKGTARYSFWSFQPKFILNQTEHPFGDIEKALKKLPKGHRSDLPPFQGGLAGYLGYDLLHYLEKVPHPKSHDMSFPPFIMGYYDTVACYDHALKKAWILSHHSKQKRDHFVDLAHSSSKYVLQPYESIPLIEDAFSKKAYQKAVEKMIGYIRAGDIFEANMTRRLKYKWDPNQDAFNVYAHLRLENPSPFSGFMNFGDVKILSSSPERFLKLNDGIVETRPIKGTRKRYPNDLKLDEKMKNDLKNSEKDKAENLMIVDLMRNDLSRVCDPFSVRVDNLLDMETYPTVHHLVSTVTGTLKKNHNAVDLLKATFPGGSITGAPKIRSMEIISELEPTKRGPYCGSMGYINANNVMDTNILIRTLCIKGDELCFNVGGAVTVDSDPEDEYEETNTKASALKKILQGR